MCVWRTGGMGPLGHGDVIKKKTNSPLLRADSVHSTSHVWMKSDQTTSSCNAFPDVLTLWNPKPK